MTKTLWIILAIAAAAAGFVLWSRRAPKRTDHGNLRTRNPPSSPPLTASDAKRIARPTSAPRGNLNKAYNGGDASKPKPKGGLDFRTEGGVVVNTVDLATGVKRISDAVAKADGAWDKAVAAQRAGTEGACRTLGGEEIFPGACSKAGQLAEWQLRQFEAGANVVADGFNTVKSWF